MNEPDFVISGRAVAIMRDVLESMPPQKWKDGARVEWGEGNKARARHAAALIGKVFDPACNSCDSDLFLLLQQTVKAADAAREDMNRKP